MTSVAEQPIQAAPLLQARDLRVRYRRDDEVVDAVRGVSFDLAEGEVVALVGESGSGKTTVASALIRLLPRHAELAASTLQLGSVDLARTSERQMRGYRGSLVSLVPQDPTVSLDPIRSIGSQIIETMKAHGLHRHDERAVAVEWLRKVGIDDPERRMKGVVAEL